MGGVLSRRGIVERAVRLGVYLCLPTVAAARPRSAAARFRRRTPEESYHPTPENRPVGPAGAAPEDASFIDPTDEVRGATHVTLGPRVYVGPFARLLADDEHAMAIEEASNLQDNVTIDASVRRTAADEARLSALGLRAVTEIGARVIIAHGCGERAGADRRRGQPDRAGPGGHAERDPQLRQRGGRCHPRAEHRRLGTWAGGAGRAPAQRHTRATGEERRDAARCGRPRPR